VLCLLVLVVGVATSGTDAYEAMSRHSFYTDEAEGHLLFVDVDGLDLLGALPEETLKQVRCLELRFDIRKSGIQRLHPTLENVKLYCTPVANLFRHDALPIRLDGKQDEYLLMPAEYSLEFVGFMTVGNQRPIEVSSPDIELIEAWPRKMIARPDEGNTLEVVFRNNTNEERPVHLEIVLRHGIETTISLVDTQISLHPGASTQRQVKVNTSGLLYGAEVVTNARRSQQCHE